MGLIQAATDSRRPRHPIGEKPNRVKVVLNLPSMQTVVERFSSEDSLNHSAREFRIASAFVPESNKPIIKIARPTHEV